MNKKEKIEHIKKLLKKRVPEFATRVTPIFALLNWQWYETGVPTRDQIIKNLLGHIDKLGGKNKVTSSSSGGLRASIKEDKSLNGYLSGVIRMDISDIAYEDED